MLAFAGEAVASERNFAAMFRREVRWQRAAGATCRPLDQSLSVLTHPLPLLLVLLLPRPPSSI